MLKDHKPVYSDERIRQERLKREMADREARDRAI